MNKEDEFETYFRRASERAPVKQLSQQYSPTTLPPTTTRRASLQAPDVMYFTQTAATSKRNSPSPSRYESRTSTTTVSPNRNSGRRRNRQVQSDDVDRQRESSSSSSAATSTRHFDHSHSPGSRSRRHRRSQLVSIVSSPADVITHRSGSHSPPFAPTTPRHGRRATLAGDLLQIPPTFGGYEQVDRRSSSVSPPSNSPGPSPSSSIKQQRATRRKLESGQPWTPSTIDREIQLAAAAVECHKRSDPVAAGGRAGHVVRRDFTLFSKGIVNVGNTVRDEEIFFDDDDVEVLSRRAEKPSAARHASAGRYTSTTADHSPRLSPHRVLDCHRVLTVTKYWTVTDY